MGKDREGEGWGGIGRGGWGGIGKGSSGEG